MATRATKYISFYLGGSLYAFPMIEGTQFISFDKLTPILHKDPKVKGLIYHNGEIVVIVDMAAILGVKAKGEHIVLLFAYQGDYYGLLIDEGSDVIKTASVMTDRQKKDLKKYIRIKKEKIYILEPSFIFSQLGINYD